MGQRGMEQLCHGQDCTTAHKTVGWKRLCPGICGADGGRCFQGPYRAVPPQAQLAGLRAVPTKAVLGHS